ncbi:MAG: TMEM165/GDT1 family protein [Micromonosporaceae bacterium]
MDLAAALTAFVVIFPAELPDKTMIATLVLATRYRPWPVWTGVTAAFFVQCVVAVMVGGVLTLLPRQPVLGVAAVLFAIGGFVMFRGASRAAEAEAAEEQEFEQRVAARGASTHRAALVSFGVLFAAEWGDLSQLFTAGLVARTGEPVSVFLGSWTALAVVAGLAVALGRTLTRRVSLAAVRRVAGALLVIIACLTAAEALGVDLPG